MTDRARSSAGSPGLLHLAVASSAALAAGLVGTRALIFGSGPIVVFGPVAADGWTIIGSFCLAWVLVATLLRRSDLGVWVARVVLLVVIVPATAPNVGRSIGLVAACSVMVSHAAFVRWRPVARSCEATEQIALLALPALGASQVVWAQTGAAAPVLVALAATLAVVDVHQRPGFVGNRWRDQVVAVAHRWRRRAPEMRRRAAVRLRGALGPQRREEVARGLQAKVPVSLRSGLVPLAMGLGVLLMAPVWHRFLWGELPAGSPSDYGTHLRVAGDLSLVPLNLPAPHIGFHLVLRAFEPLVGMTWAAMVAMSVAVMGTVVAVMWVWGRGFAGRAGLPAWLGAVSAVAYLLLDSPSIIGRALGVGNPIDTVAMLHAYYSPTDTMATGSSLVLLALVARSVEHPAGGDLRMGWELLVVAVVAAIIKPSMTVVLLCALPAYAVIAPRFTRPARWFLARWFFVPSILVVVAQTVLLEVGTSDLPRSGMKVDVLATWRSLDLDRASLWLLTSLLVVVLCLWAGARRYLREPMVGLSLLATAAGTVMLLLLRETGVRSDDAAFAKPGYMAAAMLVIVSWRFLIGETYQILAVERGPARPWMLVAGAFLVACLAGGTLSYLDAAGVYALPVVGAT